jgi:release factor glutamine methyltransferase
LNLGKQALIEHNLDTKISQLLLLDIFGYEKVSPEYYLSLQNVVSPENEKVFKDNLDLVCLNNPVQYVLGYTYFHGNKIMVNSDVLIPRFCTEELVDIAKDLIFKNSFNKVLDLCTGSGAIAISLKKLFKNVSIYASDISIKALSLAINNANLNKVKIDFFESDLLDYFIYNQMQFDLIVCNPPYVEDDYPLDLLVKHEPALALFGGKDGLTYYQNIFLSLSKALTSNGKIIFECGIQQSDKILNIAHNSGYQSLVIKDIENIERFILAWKK